jgi:hypothetical protein
MGDGVDESQPRRGEDTIGNAHQVLRRSDEVREQLDETRRRVAADREDRRRDRERRDQERERERRGLPMGPQVTRDTVAQTVHRLLGGLESRIHAALWPTERDRYLSTLDALAQARDAAQARLDALVAETRRHGATWSQIGRAVGLTRQAAHSRYRALAERAFAEHRAEQRDEERHRVIDQQDQRSLGGPGEPAT